MFNFFLIRKTARKDLIISLILATLVGWLIIPQFASAYDDWHISDFHSDITINEDSSLLVTETITADFSQTSKRGIIRNIPYKYRNKANQNFNLRYDVISVLDEAGNPWEYKLYTEGDYFVLRIGNPSIYYSEPLTYKITYSINRAIKTVDDKQELYWNATGDEWDAEILNASATITYPSEIPENMVNAICFTGGYGSSAQDCQFSINGNKIIYEMLSPLGIYEGLTIAAQFPDGSFQTPTIAQQIWWFFFDNYGYFLPFIAFLIMLYLWRTHGKDPASNRNTIVPLYEPPEGLKPVEVGTVIDETVNMHDLTATIIDLAVRGYIKIEEKQNKGFIFSSKDYTLHRLKEYKNDSTLHPHETDMMDIIFGDRKSRKISSLQNKFYKHLPKLKKDVYKTLVDKKIFPTSPENVRATYFTIGGFISGSVIFFGSLLYSIFNNVSIPIGIFVSGLVVLAFAKYMPAKTKHGVDVYYQVLGLEEFMNTAEKDRMKWKEQQNIFEKLLPYAMALGIADKWSDAFKDIYKKPPNWYASDDPGFASGFTTYHLMHSLNSMASTASSAMTSAPRSSGSGGAWSGGSGFSGGGFSGGGFGGGGGGSW